LRNTTLLKQYLTLYNIICYKRDTIFMVMETSLPNVIFIWDLISARLVVCNSLIGRLVMVKLSQGFIEFRSNLHEKGKFLVDSMYRMLTHSDHDSRVNPYQRHSWKLKLAHKDKVCFYVTIGRQLITYFFSVSWHILYG
jgi:hypothetical protein